MLTLTQKAAPNPNSWFTGERKVWIGAVVLGLCLGYAGGEARHNDQYVAEKIAPVVAHDQAVTNKVLPKLAAQVKCLKTRSDVAVKAATSDAVGPEAIPDCPKVTVAVPPAPPIPDP